MPFNNIIGLYALFAIIPFILIYLIRPKSFEKIIPSLMFIMQEKSKSIRASFLQKLLRNLLLIIQLAIILALAISIAAPYIEIPHTLMVRNNIIVLDASASMQTKDGISQRFANAIGKAKDNLGIKNTVILAESVPVIILEDATSGETLDLLNKLSPKASSTNLGDSLLLAGDMLGNKKGVINVISDFLPTEGSDLLIAKRSLTAKGNIVNFIDVNNKANNVGITDLIVDNDETIVEIKNYQDKDMVIKVILTKDNKASEKELKILAGSKEKLTFETPKGISKITLDINDDLLMDNVAYISSPEKKDLKVMLITNTVESNKIKSALIASGINLEIREPPAVNAYDTYEKDYDLVIINDIIKKLFVPTDFVDLKKYVEKGGVLIIAAQEDLLELDVSELLPITIKNKEDKTTTICADIIGMIFSKEPFSEEPCFTSTNKYLKGTAKNSTVTLASSQLDNSPIIMHMKKGLGEVVYYGIIDKYSTFYSDTFYPIFWNNLVNYLMKMEDIKEYNQKSGKMIVIKEQEVKTPSAKITTNKLLLDEVGVYEFDNKKVAVNLVNEKESDVSRQNIELKADMKKFSAEKVKDVDNIDLEIPLIILALIILFIEFIYIKRRGDL